MKDIAIDAFADMPVHQSEFTVHADGNPLPRLFDYLADVIKQSGRETDAYVCLAHGLCFSTKFTTIS